MLAFAKPSANAVLQLLSRQFHGTPKTIAWHAFQRRAALLCGLVLSLRIILGPMSVLMASLLRGLPPRRGVARGVAASIPQVIILFCLGQLAPSTAQLMLPLCVTWLELSKRLRHSIICLCLGPSASELGNSGTQLGSLSQQHVPQEQVV